MTGRRTSRWGARTYTTGHQPPGRYVDGDVYTNTIEGVFGNLKTGMRGAYKHVSPHYLRSYLDEFAWRHNAQRQGDALFGQLLARAANG